MCKSKIEDTETEAVRVKTPSNWHITKRVTVGQISSHNFACQQIGETNLVNPKNFGGVKHILHENISYCISVNNREWIIFDSNETHLVWLVSLHKRDSKSIITDFISYTPGLHHPHIDQLKKILKIMDSKNSFSSECKQYKKGLPNFQILFFGTAAEFCKKYTIMHRKTS